MVAGAGGPKTVGGPVGAFRRAWAFSSTCIGGTIEGCVGVNAGLPMISGILRLGDLDLVLPFEQDLR